MQDLAFDPRLSDFSDYILRGEIGLDLLLNSDWALRASVRHQIDSTPAAGREKDDTTLLMGFTHALGGLAEPAKEGRKSLVAESTPAEAAPLDWATTAILATNFSRGNSDNSDNSKLHLDLASAYREAQYEAFHDVAYTFGENDGVTTEDRLWTTGRYNWNPDERNFLGTGVGFLRDDLADINYRITPGLVAGRYFIKNDGLTIRF